MSYYSFFKLLLNDERDTLFDVYREVLFCFVLLFVHEFASTF